VIVTVVWATQELQDVVPVEVEDGATLAEAVRASGLIGQHALDPQRIRYAIFGKRAETDTLLAPGNRIEIVGPLIVDPKIARARRARGKEKPSTARSRR
jgi:putative ubiquitin-RnfH superfamily antitoxin RatB of RatAB toxin-antitoxin module